MPSPITVGLRFARRDAPLLDSLAIRMQVLDLKGDHDLFSSAAKSARTGEPLIMSCANEVEARLVAGGFSLYGVTPPTIDELAQARG